jgi:hypothetical protein
MIDWIHAGDTSVIVPLFIQDSTKTDGSGLAGLLYNSSGLVCKYKRQGQSGFTTVTLVTATIGTWVSGGFKEDTSGAAGDYELHLPNAAGASGARWVEIELYGATGMVPIRGRISLKAVDPQNANNFGLGAVPTAAAGAPNGLPVLTSTGILNTNPTTLLGDSDSLTGLQSAGTDYFNVDGFTVATLTNNALATVAAAAWDTLTSAARTAGSYGAKLKAWALGSDNKSMISSDAGAIPANAITAASIAAGALNGKGDWLLSTSYVAPDNADVVTALSDLVALLGRTDPTTAIAAIQTTANAIKAKTDNLPASPASTADVTASTAAVNAHTDTAVSTLATATSLAAVKTDTGNLIQMTTGTGTSREFTATALSLAPAGGGGGGGGSTTIVVAPILAQVSGTLYVTRDLPRIPAGSAPAFAWTVVDATGAAVNLTGKTVRFVVASIATNVDPFAETETALFKYETGGSRRRDQRHLEQRRHRAVRRRPTPPPTSAACVTGC